MEHSVIAALSAHPEERRSRVSKDEGPEAASGPSWFETALSRLLTMRNKRSQFADATGVPTTASGSKPKTPTRYL
jgi:hypothetical protein